MPRPLVNMEEIVHLVKQLFHVSAQMVIEEASVKVCVLFIRSCLSRAIEIC